MIDEAPPRSDATVERLTAAVVADLERSARTIMIVCGLAAFAVAAFISLPMLASHEYSIHGALAFGAALGTLSFVLPGSFLVSSRRNDARTALELVRHAPAYRGTPNHRSANMSYLSVTWTEDGPGASDYFTVPYELRLFDGEITVFARRYGRLVAVVLGDRLFLALRNLQPTRR